LIVEIVDNCINALKIKFLKEEERLKKAALLFLLCKILFTDDTANMLCIRITNDEWSGFRSFIDDIKELPAYKLILLMCYNLFNEGFLRFTIKTKPLALDYGQPETRHNDLEVTRGVALLMEIENTIDEHDLTSLNELRESSTSCERKPSSPSV